jgi:DNA polymerase III epsilon subunit-like protein
MKTIGWFDLETTGLEPGKTAGEIIEIGFVKTNGDLDVLDKHVVRVRPEHIETASARALEINGYNDEDWKQAVSLARAEDMLRRWAKGCIPGGHNVGFDLTFTEFYMPDVRWTGYHKIDTMSMASSLYLMGEVNKLSLDSLCAYFGGIERPKVHRALADVEATVEVARRLTKLVKMGVDVYK